MSKVFITSDTFFGREQIIKKAKRPFSTVEEMDEVMIENWNRVVAEDDTVYHLGNFAWDLITAEKVLHKLNGEIIFIVGEYDDALLETFEIFDGISISENEIHKDSKLKAVMSHWPLSEWPGKSRGIYHFHGATLKRLKTDMDKKSNRINVCCDNWSYTPQNIDDLIGMCEDYKKAKKKG